MRNPRISEAEIMDRLGFLSKRVMDLEAVISQKNKEIAKIEVTNRQLMLGNQKRDEIIAAALSENRRLKEKLRWEHREFIKAKKERSFDQSIERSSIKSLTSEVKSKLSDSSGLSRSPTFGRLSMHDEKLKAKMYQSLIEDETTFLDRFSSMDPQSQTDFLELMRTRQREYKSLVELTLRLKRLILATYNVSVSLMLSDAVDRFAIETCENLHCERASVFLVDEQNEELWTKVATGTNETIRIPISQGLVGYVAMTGKPLNIEDAYKDARFNKAVDLQTNYRTRSMLVIPIRDTNGKVIGVCQAINKTNGTFAPDDEALFEMLAANAGVMLRNALLNEAAIMMEERIRALAHCVLDMLPGKSLPAFHQLALSAALSLISSTEAIMYLVEDGGLYVVEEDGSLKRKEMAGLAGHCIDTGQIINVADAYNDPFFNPKVDINTTMPVIILPAKKASGRAIAVFEIVNPRGILGRAVKRKAKLDPMDNQVLGYFADIVAGMLETQFPQRMLTEKFEVVL